MGQFLQLAGELLQRLARMPHMKQHSILHAGKRALTGRAGHSCETQDLVELPTIMAHNGNGGVTALVGSVPFRLHANIHSSQS